LANAVNVASSFYRRVHLLLHLLLVQLFEKSPHKLKLRHAFLVKHQLAARLQETLFAQENFQLPQIDIFLARLIAAFICFCS
jgi:hypothetical protein